MNFVSIFGRERGMVTFPVLMICTSMLICVTTMLSVVWIRMQIEMNRGIHQMVFHAAKSVALANLHRLVTGKQITDNETSVGRVAVQTNITGKSVLTVRVRGTCSDTIDEIVFTYDTIRKKITDWHDNVPVE